MAEIIKNLDRSELESQVTFGTSISHEVVHRVLSSFFEKLIEGVALKEYVEIHGLGSFRVKKLAAKSGVDPQGEAYSVGERVTIEFNPFEDFRDQVESTTGLPCIR